MEKIRVLVVEDSLTVRKRLVEILCGDPELEVVGEAPDGRTAIELCQRLQPDVVTLDMMLPVMSGLAATEFIMAYCPTPILVVSASLNRGEVFKTYEALAAGAIDVLEKPTGTELDGAWERTLRSTVKLVSRIKVITHPRARMGPLGVARDPRAHTPPSAAARRIRAVVMGASTGGPAAVVKILRELPATFPVPILLVVHIGAAFAGPFAEWLDGQSPLRVRHAREGEVLPAAPGTVLLANPESHLVVREGRLWASREPERNSCRPSVDVLFESAARDLGDRAAGCLLTGMGRDGAAGLLAIRRAGGATIAQDEASSVIFGMPGEAVKLGAAEQVLPAEQIGAALRTLVGAANQEAR